MPRLPRDRRPRPRAGSAARRRGAIRRGRAPGVRHRPAAARRAHADGGVRGAARRAGTGSRVARHAARRRGRDRRHRARGAGVRGRGQSRRHDALWGAADLVGAVRRLARDSGGRAVATVGRLQVTPGAANVVPGRAEVTVEVRSPDGALLDALCGHVDEEARACAGRYGLSLEVARTWRSEAPVPLNRSIRDEIAAAAGDLGWPIVTMPSWAGHDAKILQALVPAGMIFVPSVGGVSHSPREQTAWDDVGRGAQTLCRTIERLDRS